MPDTQPSTSPPGPAHAGRAPSAPRAILGALGEDIAVRYLTEAGLTVLDRNWRNRFGELDVVARDGDTLVFCEVKARRGTGFGVPAAAVTSDKQQRVRTMARHWLQSHDDHATELRFDVVAVLVLAGGPARVTHLRAAF